MRRSSSPPLQFLAAAAAASSEAATMSFRPPYRGGPNLRGRNQGRRGFSDQSSGGGRGGGRGQFVTGDAHFQSVRDANLGLRPVEGVNYPNPNPNEFRPQLRPDFNPRRHFDNSPPFNPPPTFRHPHPFYPNRPSRRLQQFRPRPQKPLDYRTWEFAKPGPPPRCERFRVLSYNLLADYLATNHRSKLYFHIPEHMMEWEWRKRNIIFELGLWSADILCFQEVDRFQDLEEELKLQGYSGVWKMRTGVPVDGCAIFWRASRFKLQHEECIEYNKLGLRDNVAQICVLELLNENQNKDKSVLSSSLTGYNRVVICNIHVLYNPRRGEIKLGQIRALLERAHAVSKLWDDAPVVLCGDFNCTPKSPLYNFISDQKLDLSDLPRDKLSGQASAEIRPLRQFSPNFRAQSVDRTDGASANVGQRELRQEQNTPESNSVKLPCVNSFSHPQCVSSGLNVSDNYSINEQCGNKNNLSSSEMTKENHEVDCSEDGTRSNISVLDPDLKKSPSSPESKVGHESNTLDSHNGNICATLIETVLSKETDQDIACGCDGEFSVSGLKESASSPQDEGTECGAQSASTPNVSTGGSSDNLSPLSSAVDKDNPSTLSKVSVSLQELPLDEHVVADEEDEGFGEDSTKFLSELHDENGSFSSEFGHAVRSDLVESDKSIEESASTSHGKDVVLEDDDPGMGSEPVDPWKSAYDPSAWTPMEIEIATGNADCTFVEHPLKLRSTYAEVEDCSGTRDSNGEPLVTSYNRCFLGTVDYIWRSEGLQTVRVLAPIPKHAMQWTRGFPTQKWGSDHIAIVSELAFVKDGSIRHTEAP